MKRPARPAPPPPADPRQLDLPGITRFEKPRHITVHLEDGKVERVELAAWLEQHRADRGRAP